MLCRLFGVSPSGFYAFQTRPESKRLQEDRRRKALLHASFTSGRGYYGSPRIHDDFIEWGRARESEADHPLEAGGRLQARVRKRYKVTTDTITISR
jgi:putative transposase